MEAGKAIGVVLNSEPLDYSDSAIRQWQNAGFEYRPSSWSEIDQTDAIPNVKILIVRLARIVDKSVLDKFPDLIRLVSATTGQDHIVRSELVKRGIQLVSLRGETEFLRSIPSTAEHTWALLMSLLRNVPTANEHVKQGKWERDRFKGNQLRNKTLGVIGLGRTGTKVAEYARSFGMHVVYYDPFINYSDYGSKCTILEDLLRESDIITIHVHVSDLTSPVINLGNVNSIKKGAYLINTSRGGVWDEDSVAQGLDQGNIAGVATDVLSTELLDITRSALWSAQKRGKNVIITPHIGGATYEAMHSCELHIANLTLGSLQGN